MPAGRPSAYDRITANLDRLETYMKSGYTIEQAANAIGVGYETLRKYSKRYPEISETIKNAKENLVLDIEKNLYNIVMGKGISRKTTYKYVYDDEGNEHVVEKTVVEEPIRPTTSDFVFVLTNLTSNRENGIIWKNRQDENDMSILEAIKNSKLVLDKISGAMNEDTSDE